MLEIDGWIVTNTKGHCRQYTHRSRDGLLTIAGRPGDEIGPNTLRTIFARELRDEVFDYYRTDSHRLFSIFT